MTHYFANVLSGPISINHDLKPSSLSPAFQVWGPVWTQLNLDAGTSFLMTSPYPANSRRWRAASRRLQFQGEKKLTQLYLFFRRGRDRDKEPSNFFRKFEWKQFFFANGILKGRFLAANWKKMSTHRRRDKTNKTELMFPKPRHFPVNETVHSLPISSSSPFFFVETGFEPVFRELSPILRCNFWICRNGTNVSKIFCPWFLATEFHGHQAK